MHREISNADSGSSQVQWNLLMEQQAANVWRKRAFSAMKSAQDQFGKDVQGSDRLLGCLDTFRERVDHSVENLSLIHI